MEDEIRKQIYCANHFFKKPVKTEEFLTLNEAVPQRLQRLIKRDLRWLRRKVSKDLVRETSDHVQQL